MSSSDEDLEAGVSQVKTKRAKRLVLSSSDDDATPVTKLASSPPSLPSKKDDLISLKNDLVPLPPTNRIINSDVGVSSEDDILHVSKRLIKTGDLLNPVDPPVKDLLMKSDYDSSEDDVLRVPKRLIKTGDLLNPVGSPVKDLLMDSDVDSSEDDVLRIPRRKSSKSPVKLVDSDKELEDITISPSLKRQKPARNPLASKKARLDLERETQRLLRGKLMVSLNLDSRGWRRSSTPIWLQSS